MSREQRKHPRIPLDVEVDFKGRAIARSKDISKEGISLITEEALSEGKILNLRFFLPEAGSEVKCFGKVMWVRKAGEHLFESGLQFWDIGADEEKQLNAYFSD